MDKTIEDILEQIIEATTSRVPFVFNLETPINGYSIKNTGIDLADGEDEKTPRIFISNIAVTLSSKRAYDNNQKRWSGESELLNDAIELTHAIQNNQEKQFYFQDISEVTRNNYGDTQSVLTVSINLQAVGR